MRIAISLGHDSSLVYEDNLGKLRIDEFERFFKVKKFPNNPVPLKYSKINPFVTDETEAKEMFCFEDYSRRDLFKKTFDYIKNNTKINPDLVEEINISCCLDSTTFNITRYELKKIFKNVKTFNSINHRLCHALSVYGTIQEKRAISIVADGGGNGVFTVIKHSGFEQEVIHEEDNNFGSFYETISKKVLSDIGIHKCESKEGVFMGFSGYGKIDINLYTLLVEIMCSFSESSYKRILRINQVYEEKKDLGFSINDFSKTFQKAWVHSFMSLVSRFKDDSEVVCVSGGCFLNCELNRDLLNSKFFKKVYFTPLASDCGQSLGAYLVNRKKEFKIYHGSEAYDKECFQGYLASDKFTHNKIDTENIAKYLFEDKIVGIFRGPTEVGPRALGNRSILANPLNPDMKQILNDRVKHRHWFRPFGAIVPRENLSEYFDLDLELNYMNVLSYSKTSLFPSITHIDNSTRIQTVNEEDNPFLLDLLTKFKSISGHPVLINTSFNTQGYPVVNWYQDAFEMLLKGEIDYLVLDDYIFHKNSR